MAELKGVPATRNRKVNDGTYKKFYYNFITQIELGISQIKRWNTSMKFDYFFATQYKQSLVYFGLDAGTTIAHKDGSMCTMNGCVATLVEGVNKEDSYVWSPMPQLSLRLSVNDNVNGSVKLCGGYASEEEIKMFGEISKPEYSNQMLSSKGYYMSKVIPQQWNTSLLMPSLCKQWVEDAPSTPRLNLLSIQKCHQYVVRFYAYNNFTMNVKDCHVLSPLAPFT